MPDQSRRIGNPIAFNPDTMTVGQLKECAETLSQAFDSIDRGVDAENIMHNLKMAQAMMVQRYGLTGLAR